MPPPPTLPKPCLMGPPQALWPGVSPGSPSTLPQARHSVAPDGPRGFLTVVPASRLCWITNVVEKTVCLLRLGRTRLYPFCHAVWMAQIVCSGESWPRSCEDTPAAPSGEGHASRTEASCQRPASACQCCVGTSPHWKWTLLCHRGFRMTAALADICPQSQETPRARRPAKPLPNS